MKRTALLLLLLTTFMQPDLQGQDRYTDSLQKVVQTNKSDSARVEALLELAIGSLSENLDEAFRYANLAVQVAKEKNYLRGLAKAYKYVGMVHYYRSKWVEALENWQLSYEIFERVGDKVGMANMLNNMGAIYFNEGDNAKALENYLLSLNLAEESKDTLRIATAMINVGAVYMAKSDTYDLALQYYMKAIVLTELLDDKESYGSVCVNIGDIYLNQGKDTLALEYFEKSLEAVEGLEAMPYVMISIGRVYQLRKDHDKAIAYYIHAYEIADKNEQAHDMIRALVAAAKAYQEIGNLALALERYEEALPIAQSVKANKELKEIYQGLAYAFSYRKQYDSAFKYQELLTNVKDTLYNIETDKKLSSMMFNFELEKRENMIDLLTTEKELKEQNLQKQKQIRNLIGAGLLSSLLFLLVVLGQKKRITREKKRSEELLLNILPEETANELKAKGHADAKMIDLVTVLFTDFKGFTQLSEKLTPRELVDEINECFSAFDRIMGKYGVEKIKTIGDAYMAAGGLPSPNSTHAMDVVKAAIEIQRTMNDIAERKRNEGKLFFEIRIGIHTGPVVAGIVGIKKFQYDIWGDTVNTASRMESSGEVGRVNISEVTYEFVKDAFPCEYRGKVAAKGKGEISMYFVNAEGIEL
jgi:class 3 adenylate cyclase